MGGKMRLTEGAELRGFGGVPPVIFYLKGGYYIQRGLPDRPILPIFWDGKLVFIVKILPIKGEYSMQRGLPDKSILPIFCAGKLVFIVKILAIWNYYCRQVVKQR